MSPPGCQKMLAKPCNRNAEESFPVLSLKSREQKPPNPLLIQDKNALQPSSTLMPSPDTRRHGPRQGCTAGRPRARLETPVSQVTMGRYTNVLQNRRQN